MSEVKLKTESKFELLVIKLIRIEIASPIPSPVIQRSPLSNFRPN